VFEVEGRAVLMGVVFLSQAWVQPGIQIVANMVHSDPLPEIELGAIQPDAMLVIAKFAAAEYEQQLVAFLGVGAQSRTRSRPGVLLSPSSSRISRSQAWAGDSPRSR